MEVSMFGISQRMFGVVACAALGCLLSGTLVRGDAPATTGTITGTGNYHFFNGNFHPGGRSKGFSVPSPWPGRHPSDGPLPLRRMPPAGGQPGDQGGAGAGKHHHPKPIAETTTDSDGKYSFTNVAAGSYNVVAMLKGTGAGHGEATVTAGGSVAVDITLTKHQKKAPSTN